MFKKSQAHTSLQYHSLLFLETYQAVEISPYPIYIDKSAHEAARELAGPASLYRPLVIRAEGTIRDPCPLSQNNYFSRRTLHSITTRSPFWPEESSTRSSNTALAEKPAFLKVDRAAWARR